MNSTLKRIIGASGAAAVVAGAVAASSAAYGAAHGFKSWGRLGASVAAALAFTIGYAVTRNLWWLMLVHAGLALLGLVAARRARSLPADAPRGEDQR